MVSKAISAASDNVVVSLAANRMAEVWHPTTVRHEILQRWVGQHPMTTGKPPNTKTNSVPYIQSRNRPNHLNRISEGSYPSGAW